MVALRYARRVCRAALGATAFLSLLVGCSNGRGSVEEAQNESTTFTVGGNVGGLTGAGLMLRLNGAGDLPVSSNGAFTFASRLASGAAYEVTIGVQPTNPAQTCTIANGAGQIAASNVTNVSVACVVNAGAFAVRGVVTGLAGSGLVLQNNGGDDLAIAGDGEFSFATAVATGANYSVSVAASPANPSQTCSIENAAGVMGVADVTNVRVICSTNSFSISGTVTALTGLGLVLVNNGENMAIGGNGTFTFPTRLASGAAYNVTIAAQPAGQTCTVQNAAGIVLNENVTNVTVACATDVYTIGGTVTGLAAGARLVLRLAVAAQQDDRQITTNGGFDFGIAAVSGAGYVVSVLTQPVNPSQECVVENATGIIAGANVTNVMVACTTRSFTIGGTVTGLLGSGLVLHNGPDSLSIVSSGSFTFPTPQASGSHYNVTVQTQPSNPTQTCTVASGSGAVGGDHVRSVRVTCATSTFRVGGAVTGLLGDGVVLENNGRDAIEVVADGDFFFPQRIASGGVYNVTVQTNPRNPTQGCVVARGVGTIGSTDVHDVAVTCTTSSFTIGGSVSGLEGSGLIVRNNGGDDLAINSNGAFAFTTPVASGQRYNVTIATQPTSPTQVCTLENASGVVGGGNITNINIRCEIVEFTVGGHVSGLAGSGLVLQNNGGDNLAIASSGAFTFRDSLPPGAPYNVTVLTQPVNPSQTCVVANGSGTIGSGDVANIAVTCTTNSFTIGGTVAGLEGSGLLLRLNGGNDLPIASNGNFTFGARLDSGVRYEVTVASPPANPPQTCTVQHGSGTVGGGDVRDVRVTCAVNRYSIGGTVSGLLGDRVVLQNNGGDPVEVTANGAFTFPTQIASGGAYSVTVSTSPSNPTQSCAVANGSGIVGAAAVTNVAVTCTTSSFTVGGAVSGLAGAGLVLRNNGVDDLSVNSNGPFAFATPLASGQSYNVTIAAQPTSPTQSCIVENGSGVVGGGDVTSVGIRCETAAFTVGGHVSGLHASGLVLQNNGGDNLAIASNGSFSFGSPSPSGSTYNVTVLTQPTNPSQTCVVTNGSGTITNGDVKDVEVDCTTNSFTIGGTVSGLQGAGLTLENNGDAIGAGNGAFTFPEPVASGDTYNVTVRSQPILPPQTCSVANGAGTVGAANVTNVAVSCQ
jgi:large repetitive protein